MRRGAKGRLAHERVGIDRPAAGRAQLDDRLHVSGGVHEFQLGLGGGRRLAPLPPRQLARVDGPLDLEQALGSVGVRR